jgi:RNA polymerase sigma factor (sigma-70 family)
VITDQELLEAFRDERDESAFQSLVERHGPMVWRVCRDILHEDSHAIDDAYQNTFLLLTQRAHSIHSPEVLGRWLHGVARRVAVRARIHARRQASLRAVQMIRELPPADSDCLPPDLLSELSAAIHEEVDRLPPRFRAPIVLRYLEERSLADVAAELGCPRATVKGRLRKGREILRDRLRRRGVAVTTLMLWLFLTEHALAAPASLNSRIVKAALRPVRATGSAQVQARPRSLRRRGRWIGLAATLAIALVAGVLVVGPNGARAWSGRHVPQSIASWLGFSSQASSSSGGCH